MQHLLLISLTAGVLILLVLLLRLAALHRLSKTWFVILWAFILAKLLLPVQLPILPHALALTFGETDASTLSTSAVLALPSDSAASASVSGAMPVLPLVWGIGTAGFSIAFFIFYIGSLRRFADAIQIKNCSFLDNWIQHQHLRRPLSVCFSDKTRTPFTVGLFRPRIILPKMDLTETDTLTCILEHEMVHIRRFDCVWKLLGAAAVCIHWFNPFVWLFHHFSDRDLELSCDERVLRRMQADCRSQYAGMLIRMAEHSLSFSPTGSGFSCIALKERVLAVMKDTHSHAVAVFAAILLAGTVCFSFATGAQAAVSLQFWGTPGQILQVSTDGGTLLTKDAGETGTAPMTNTSVGTFRMPNAEPGMYLVYDGTGAIMKIQNAAGDLFYEPTDTSETTATEFIVMSNESSSTIYNLDDPQQLQEAQTAVKNNVPAARRSAVLQSLQKQRGTHIRIYWVAPEE